jgi:hypothetical protein
MFEMSDEWRLRMTFSGAAPSIPEASPRWYRLEAVLLHQIHELREQRRYVVRPGARLRVSLKAESGASTMANTLQRAVEQRTVRRLHLRRQGLLIDREAVILTADHDLTSRQHLHRMIGTMMTELHLHGPCAGGQTQQLMPQTDAEQRHVRGEQFANRDDGVVARLGSPGPLLRNTPSGCIAITSAAGVLAGTTVTRQP